MSKAVKQLMVNDLVRSLQGVTDIVAGSITGMTSQDTVKFRAALRAKNVRAMMVRNAMCARAFDALGISYAQAMLEGPTVLFFGGDTMVDTAKALVEQAKAFPALQIRSGITGGQVLSAADVTALSKLPRREEHPYIFYMGADFRKLKAPSFWYDIVSVAVVLSKYEFVRDDLRFLEMVAHIKSKQDKDGFFTPESVYLKLKDWDFGQKKVLSPYLTYLCWRIFERLK